MTGALTSVPPLRMVQDGPSLGEQMTALPVATLALLVALTVNMGMKLPVGFVLGPRRYALRVALGLAILIGGLWAGHAVGLLLG